MMFANKQEFFDQGRPFVIGIDTRNTGTTNVFSVRLPVLGNYTVDWGDNNITNEINTSTHIYANSGTYTIKISSDILTIDYRNRTIFPLTGTDSLKLISIDDWGSIRWKNRNPQFGSAPFGQLLCFQRCENIQYITTSGPILSDVNNLQNTFFRANVGNTNLNNWDTSNIKSTENMFDRANFSGQLSNWNMSNNTNTAFMFNLCVNFNDNINNWDVSNVITMAGMFAGATSFNQPLNNWDTGNVTNMSNMFNNADAFNQDISNWDVSKVISFDGMFENANYTFNLGTWNLNTTTTYSTSTSISMNRIFFGRGLNTSSYSQTLIGWANYVYANNGPHDVDMSNQYLCEYNNTNYGGTPFNNAVAARAFLTASTGGNWTITGDSQV